MKQVNVLLDDCVNAHLERWAAAESYNRGVKITVTDVVRRAIKDFTHYGTVDLKVEFLADGRMNASYGNTVEVQKRVDDEMQELIAGKIDVADFLTIQRDHVGDVLQKIGAFEKLKGCHMKNYAAEANELREKKLEQGRIKQAEVAIAQERLAQESKKKEELEKQNTDALLPLFKQFDNHKVSCGELEASTTRDSDGNNLVCLKYGKLGVSFMRSWKELGSVLLAARYFSEQGKYILFNYDRGCGAPCSMSEYNNADDLMVAVTEAVSGI